MWPGGVTKAPSDSPECGWKGELCEEERGNRSAGRDANWHRTTRADANRHRTTRPDDARHEPTRSDTTRHEPTRHDTRLTGTKRREPTRYDTARREPTPHDSTWWDTNRHDATRTDTARRERTRLGKPRHEANMHGTCKTWQVLTRLTMRWKLKLSRRVSSLISSPAGDSSTYIIIACCTVFGAGFVTVIFIFVYRWELCNNMYYYMARATSGGIARSDWFICRWELGSLGDECCCVITCCLLVVFAFEESWFSSWIWPRTNRGGSPGRTLFSSRITTAIPSRKASRLATYSDQLQISPAASPVILHHTVWRTWLFIAYSDKRRLCHQFALPHWYISP